MYVNSLILSGHKMSISLLLSVCTVCVQCMYVHMCMNGKFCMVHTHTLSLSLPLSPSLPLQIETNRNTALTLACFQGRHEVVSLLVERQANVEHRAKVSLPLINPLHLTI